MELNKITAEVDMNLLQQKANEFAQKGAEKEVEDFYSGYDSPYRKAIKENLKNKGVDSNFDIPDIIAVLNEKFKEEVDQIANTAVAKSFLPIIKSFLSREDAEIKFSDILRKFIETTEFKNSDDLDSNDYVVEKLDGRHSSSSLNDTFFDYTISNGKVKYEIHFFKKDTGLITIMSLPYMVNELGRRTMSYESKQTMKISIDGGATLELPFTKGILEDPFMSYIARLVIGNNNIIFDTTDFDEDMFPNDHCHC
jgi:hypothetical protein